ncbi:MAG TPA: hypothetical protein VLE93_03590 [Candidatus Saccharimonadales bacterium]|nr:hypothetical protein [Candidatus Saccharimonadales bacterium]
MRALVKLTIFALLAVSLLPNGSRAFSLQSLGSAVSATTNQNLYRLRAPGKTWQLASITSDQLSAAPIVFSNQLVFTAKTGSLTKLYRSTGLAATELGNISGDALALQSLGDAIIVGSQTGQTLAATEITNDWTLMPLTAAPLIALDQTNRFYRVGGQLFFGQQFNQFVRVLQWQNHSWPVVASFPCAGSVLVTAPLVGFSCADGQFYYQLNPTNYQPLFPVSVQNITTGGGLVAATDAANNLYVWHSNLLETFALNLTGRSVTGLKLLADRVFLRLSDASWWEFGLTSHVLTAPPGDLTNLAAADGTNRLLVKVGPSYFVSDGPESWQLATTDGDLTALKKVPGGWLAWQPGASLVQFAADNTNAFKKVTGAWASSSQLQAVYAQAGLGLILLLNSSSNPNLYQSTDFQSWSRVTLPTAPTYTVSIGEARSLPANALAEISGVVSVPVGAVGSEALYLQDETGGIQVFLDNSKGALPGGVNKLATATGQISTSQTKRLILSALDDLAIGSAQTWPLSEFGVDELVNHLGQAVTVKANLSATASDSFNLTTAGGFLKFHFPTNLLNYAAGSLAQLPLVTDYNSSSGAIETWYLGSGASLISAPATGVINATTAALTSAVSSTTTKTVGKTLTTQVKKSSTVAAAAGASLPLAAGSNQPTLVAGAQENDFAQTAALAVASFLAGALAIRGRRFNKLFGL